MKTIETSKKLEHLFSRWGATGYWSRQLLHPPKDGAEFVQYRGVGEQKYLAKFKKRGEGIYKLYFAEAITGYNPTVHFGLEKHSGEFITIYDEEHELWTIKDKNGMILKTTTFASRGKPEETNFVEQKKTFSLFVDPSTSDPYSNFIGEIEDLKSIERAMRVIVKDIEYKNKGECWIPAFLTSANDQRMTIANALVSFLLWMNEEPSDNDY